MKLNKMKLIISVIAIIAFLSISLNMNVWAAALTLEIPNTENNVSGDLIEVVDGTSNQTVANNSNTNTNTPGELANTGLEELPWLLIGVCVVSAIFAYRKIKEYKAY